MEKKELITNLQLLSRVRTGGEPSAVWVAKSRRAILARVADRQAAAAPRRSAVREAVSAFPLAEAFRFAFQPAGVFAALFVVLFSGWAGAVSASYGAVPGDALYPLKRATERAQLAFVTSADQHARMQVDFMGRRVDEIARLAQTPAAGQGAHIDEAVANLREDASAVEHDIASLRTSAPAKAVAVAQLVDRKADEYHATLRRTDRNPSAPRRGGLQEAKDIVVDASVRAVAIIIEGSASGAVTASEVASSVGDKIRAVADRVSDVEGSLAEGAPASVQESANQAKAALSEATNLIAARDLSAAFAKLVESKELVRAAEAIATVAADQQAGLAASGTIPAAKGVLLGDLVTTGIGSSSAPATVSTTPATVGDRSSESGTTLPTTATSSDIINLKL